jgi:hypothetical protein
MYFRNPNFGLAIKEKVCKRVREKGDLRGISYTPKSARECETMNPHTPNVTPTLGDGIPKDSRIFKERLQGPKPICLKNYLYY